jgi:outer membrane protein OmpA-like peptidoglycan-associated protein/type II secretory pathway pseudopilin PulG
MSSISRILIFLAAFTVVSTLSYAQQQDKEQATQYMEMAKEILKSTSAVDDARDLMITAANYDTTNVDANYEAGHLQIETINKDLAVKYFLRIYRQNPRYRFDLEYWIGKSYQYGLNFNKALDFFERYKKKLEQTPSYAGKDKIGLEEINRKIFESQNAKELITRPKNLAITNIGREINSPFEDYAPVLTESETEMIFTSRRQEGNLSADVFEDNKPFEDIFYAKKTGEKWVAATNIGSTVNTASHDSNLALSPDGKMLFVYKTNNEGDIYFSTRQPNGSWSEPAPLPGVINSSFRETSVSITKDGKTLYFASDRPGGLGGSDIYASVKDNKGEWTRAKNLGAKINTALDEDSPFIDYDQKILYFSSQGGKGIGGFDIFKSTLLDAEKNEWSDPENMGFPINTPDDDIFYVASKDGQRGYYASVREDGMGYSDIYLISVPKPQTEKKAIQPLKYTVKVMNADKMPMDATVKLKGADNVNITGSSKEAGVYEFSITSTSRMDYQLSVEKEGYAFVNELLNIEAAGEFAKAAAHTVLMRKLEVGVKQVLRNIYFDYDKATFKSESYNELNKLETMIKQNAGLNVEISGHTDNFGKAEYNKRLSLKRANAVKDFLTSKGIDPRSVTTVGYGEEKPLVSNDDESDGRSINRRVEFKVLGN